MWRIGYDDCETSSYRVEMVEVMIINQDIICNLTLLNNLLNLKTDTDSYVYFIHLFCNNLYCPVHCYCMYQFRSPNSGGAEIIEVN